MRHNPIVIIALVTALSLAGDSMLYICLPVYWPSLGLGSVWHVGVLLALNRFVRLPLNPVTGWVYKKAGLRKGLIIAVALGTFPPSDMLL